MAAPPLDFLLKELEANGLLWKPETRRGIVIASDDTEVSGTVEYVVPAPTWDDGRALETRLEQILITSNHLADHA